jgi:hypothetical protein
MNTPGPDGNSNNHERFFIDFSSGIHYSLAGRSATVMMPRMIRRTGGFRPGMRSPG